MESKATPRPWKAPFINDGEPEITITDDDQMYGIAVVHEKYSESKEAAKANAELIVKSVNMHTEFKDFSFYVTEMIKKENLTSKYPALTKMAEELFKRSTENLS